MSKESLDYMAAVSPDMEKLRKMIRAIAIASHNQRERVRIAAVCAVEHAILHGNATPLTQLHEALGSDARRNAFISWCINFGPVRWIEGKKSEKDGAKLQGHFGMDTKRAEQMKAEHAADRIALLSPMVKLPYWEYKPEPAFEGLSVAQLIAAAAKKAAKVHDDEELAKHEDNDFAGLEELLALSAKYPPKQKLKKGKGTTETRNPAPSIH